MISLYSTARLGHCDNRISQEIIPSLRKCHSHNTKYYPFNNNEFNHLNDQTHHYSVFYRQNVTKDQNSTFN